MTSADRVDDKTVEWLRPRPLRHLKAYMCRLKALENVEVGMLK